jgi:CBS domain containing-hemolysin-like protein
VTEWVMLAASLALVLTCGVFVAAEFAFVTVSRTQVDRAVADGVPGAEGVQRALRSLSTHLSGAQVGITITNLGIGYLAEPSIAALLRGPLTAAGLQGAAGGISWTVALALSTVLTMLFGELVPKNLAIAEPLAVARAVQLPQRMFTAVTRPLTSSLNAAANWIVRRLGVEPQEELASTHSPAELASLLELSAEAGAIERPVADIVRGTLRLDDKMARDVLSPRTTLLTVPSSDPVQAVIDVVREHGVSRLPVTRDGIDDVVGVVELCHAVAVPPARRRETTVAEVARAVVTVPDTVALDDLLWSLRDQRSELALVLDEYGGTAGIVTLEDIMEEIVGEVSDEHDAPEAPVQRVDERTLRLSGLVRPDELDELTGVRLPEGDHSYETVAGLVMQRLGRVPELGDTVEVDGSRLEVTAMDGHRIAWLRLRHGMAGDDDG